MDSIRKYTVITMYGESNLENKNRWKEWLLFSKDIIMKSGFSPTHIGIMSAKNFKSGKIIDFKRAKNRIEKAMEIDVIKNMELYSLPENFKQALFDFHILTIKEENIDSLDNISVIFKNHSFDNLDKNLLISEMRSFINLKEGEVFEISYPENPLMYISKLNSADYYKTLNIIKKLI